ncbi:NADPH-dependent 7-cyano-7-deazaguanine reductase QueF [Estrella lausannensis]|uniref:NADPH-dependent 7-cyano-7-deazaguanine reductase n=1 Tax=Estrella lausannensis TaxID=483423 RepID=A0A0H5DS27_9BACT|nr:NADPH-dependent 7-cyano-7-deazaguanine reductase QueF [Estrella lausannensis]CRX39467.1 NADPH-dependent 7-cyano-7-deazaguanine reductase [Estrella lausannensis]
MDHGLKTAPLGKKTDYVEEYCPELLFPVERKLARDLIGLQDANLPFDGFDIWNGMELSWLGPKGKPEIAIAVFTFPCASPHIVESKSFKLYLNSFNQSIFPSYEAVREVMVRDLSKAVGASVQVSLTPAHKARDQLAYELPGVCLDSLDISINDYEFNPNHLKAEGAHIDETVHSHLLKSNCLATGQPDWGSLLIRYKGPKIDHEGLLKYIISFRRHSGFAEHCVERVFFDIQERCRPDSLTVYARYTRRGGLDINPFRSNFETEADNARQIRQ